MGTRFRFTGRIALLLALLLALALPSLVTAAPYPTPYLNGFENASDVTPLPSTSDTDTMFGLTRVASGTNGVTSADGSWHATAPLNTTDASLFTRLGGYQSVFPAGGFSVSVDIYLDTANAGPTTSQLDWSAAISNASGAHLRDFAFSIGGNGAGGYLMSASNNTPGWPGNPARDPYTITTTGWYTFKHVFRDNAGVLAVDMQVLDAAGTLLKSWTLSNPADTIPANVGGNRYAWLVTNEYPDLPLDNVTRSGTCSTTCYADVVSGDDANGGTSAADAKKTIQAAVNQVSVGGTVIAAAGTYPENVTVNKKLTLDGAGSGSNPATATIIDPVTGRGLMISGSGVSAADRLIIKDLRVTGAPDDGITLEGPSGGSYLTLDNVASVGQTGPNSDGIEIKNQNLITDVKIVDSNLSGNALSGFRMGTGTKLDGFTVENTVFDGNQYGLNVFAANPAPTFNNITFTNVAFTNNTQKGIYTERLNNATFTGLTVTGNGSTAGNFLAGIDINLKYANFTNITIENSAFANNGLADNANSGVDLTVKARNDGSYASSPATLTNLDVNHVTFSGTADAAVSLGNNLDEATTTINRNAFGGTNTAGLVVFGTPVATMINAECNWWNAASGPAGVGPGSGNAVSPNADYTPWLFTNDLDGPCVTGATIKVSKVTDPNTDTTTVFTFDPSWSATDFTLKNGESLTSAPLPPATYSVVEVSMPALWAQQSATCDNTATGPVETEDPSSLTVAAGENWECTFTNKQLELCSTVCYADDANGNDADDGQTPGTAFKTIQKAIDTVAVGGEVRVLPGSYDETATNRYVLDNTPLENGPHQFGLFIATNGVTIQGYNAAGTVAITDPNATLADITTNATNNFGTSGIFVEGDDVTIAGLEIGPNTPGENKTLEIIGDGFTLENCLMTGDGIDGAYPYFNDWRYDDGTDTAYLQSYTVDNNVFGAGSQIAISSGAGASGPASGRQITDNVFTMGAGQNWPAISFNGAGGVAWFTYPVGGAIITGNTFNNVDYGAEQWIRARGDYIEAQFDWASYWNDNSYDNATVAGVTVPANPRPYAYSTFTNVRRIGAKIQAEIDTVAAANDTVLVMEGVYPENVTIAKSLTLTGSGQTDDANGTVLEGTGKTGSAILVNTGVTDVTIENLRAQNYTQSGAAGVYANGQNNNFTVQNVTSHNNGAAPNNGGGVYMNGPVDNVLIDHVTATNNKTRGIVIWNGFKTDITITNNTVTGNVCCGIELQDGTASGVTVTGNTVSGNADSGMAFTGLTSGAGPNVISGNTLTNNGRFGMEIKLPNGTGLATGDGSIVIENNTVTLNAPPADLRDFAGIAAFRRGWVAGNNNVDIPTGVIIRNNTVSGYQQTSTSEGFGVVVEGLNMTVTGNTLTNNEVGAQVQGGHLPYTANTAVDGDQSNLADQFFGRGNSPIGCAVIDGNTFTGNTADTRKVGTGGTVVAENLDTGEQFCSIQAAINDADTVNGHTIKVYPGVHTENVLVTKSVTLEGANAGISPNDPGDPLNPNPARVAETEMASTGGNQSFKVQTANVTIDGFKFTDSGVAQANAQSPIIGAGVNFGGDAPGVKIVNNLFFETNRMVVYFLGPTLMQGGTVDDNRVENPDRPDTGCGSGAVATSNCGHQLFNLWNTNNVSFQDNVTIAAPASGDRIRTLNVNDSTNVTIAGNTVRYTCTYTCFTVAAGTANNVTVTDNDLVTDVGNVIQIFSTWTTGNVNVHHNILTTGNDFPIVVDNLTADLDNVHINRNAVTGAGNARNGNDSLTTPGAETLDVTCNWWGSAAEPTAFFGPNNHTPWLFSSDLDGPCALGGTITVVKQTTPDGDPAVFEFDPSWGANFTLSDGQSNTSAPLPPATYSVAEVNLAAPWTLANASCSNGATTAPPSAIPMAAGETWTCTFENTRPICTTVCYVDAVNGNDAANGGTGPSDAFQTIQKAIDTVNVGGEIRVLPGTYDQDEKNGVDNVTDGPGPYQFNLWVNKDITIQGVTAGDIEITDPNAAVAIIKPKRDVPVFGTSAMFILADGVTVTGVKFVSDNGTAFADKTIEVIGNDVTIDGVAFDVTGGAVGVYIGDFSYDASNDVSTIADYTITNSAFTSTDQTGMAFQAANGAGWPDNVGTRAITNNTFVNLDDALTFAGAGSAGWRLYPVGTADITGNTFSQIKRRHVMAWGNYPISNPTALGYAEPDWCGIIANNTFDKGSMLWAGTTQCPSGQPRRWDAASGNAAPYDWFRNVAGIYSAIQQYGVNKAVSGDLLHVFPGTYVEQVMVNKSMTLLGSGPAVTFIKPPATLPIASDPNSVIVKITGANVSVEMSQFTVSGPGPSSCGSIAYGIVVRDGAHADIHDNTIADIKDTGLSGCQNGIGILVGRAAWSTTGTADITDNVIETYQKGGIVVSNTGSSATITGNTVSGDGPVSYIAENGIQVSSGATAEINGNTVTGHSYNGSGWTSTGMLLYGPGVINTDGNTVSENQVGIYLVEAPGTHQNNTISATATGTGVSYFWGLVVDAPPPNLFPAPFEDEANGPAANGPAPQAPLQTVAVTGNTFTSDNSAGGVGLATYAGYGASDIDLTATKNLIHNWALGVEVYECTGGGCAAGTFSNVKINRNSIAGNTDGMFADTVDAAETDATCNWWGNASGPSDAGPGTGDTVSTEVDFAPWLYSNDLDGPCFTGGTISIDKVAPGGGATAFEFDVSWSATNVTLTDADAPYVSALLPADDYSVTEVNLPAPWVQLSATCDNAATPTTETADPSAITLADGDTWQCTFTNKSRPLCTTICYADIVNGSDTANGGTGPADAFKTIQMAIDTVTPGGEVRVLPGTYPESPTVHKSVTMVGVNGRDVTFIALQTGTNYTHSLLISGADVTMDGFTVVGIDAACPTLAATNIYVSHTADNVLLTNNRLQVGAIDGACSTGDDGFGLITEYTAQPDVATLTVEDTIFEPLTAAGGQRAFYINPSVVSFVLRDSEINGRFDGTAITQAQDSLIEDNTITGSGASAGIGVWGEPDPTVWGHATIQRNTITGTANAITIYEAQNVTVTKNILNANGRGVRVTTVMPLVFDKTTIHINRNAITNNTTEGISNLLTETGDIDGTCNWWNSASGPGAVASGSGDKVSAKVDYTPWLFSDDLDGPCFVGGTISIDKVAANGGALEFEFDLSWSANNVKLTDSSAPYVSAPLVAGEYTIDEVNVPAGWALDSVTCLNMSAAPITQVPIEHDAVITVADGDAWVCTFTNKPLGTIQIAKVATGGGTTAFEFDVSWSPTNVTLTDGQSTTPVALAAGQYTIDEVNVPAGWTLAGATCINQTTSAPITGSPVVNDAVVNVANGDNWVCTFTNVKLGTIQIAKVANGGGATEFEFDVSWSGDNVTLQHGQSSTPAALVAGSYNISEVNVPAGWTLQSATCDNTATAPVETANPSAITLANGDTWVCTFTNVKQGTIQIAKVAPGAGSLVFTFDVTWSGDNVTLTDGQSTTPVPLVAGNYGITEVNVPPGWASVSATCDNAITPAAETVDPASITVANGDAWICTFTNSLLGTVRIAKVATGGGTTTFEFDPSWSATNVTLADGQSTTAEPLAAGTYSVTEVNIPAGWVAQSATCDNGSTPAVETVNPSSIPVANGDAWVCTFTNVKLGTIQIAKVAAGGGTTTFEFDPSWSATNVTLQHGQSTTPVALAAGTASVTEVNLPAGWALDSVTCVNGQETAPVSAIPVENGDTWVCTFTNVKKGTVQIAKSAPGGGTTTFEFDVSWSGTNVTLQHGQSTTPVALAAGTYSVTEVNLPQYWMLSSSTCVNGAETAPVSAIPVENGDAWVCTFNNVYAPSSTCAVGAANTQWTDLLGIGMGSPKKHKASAKLVIPNYTNLVDLYGQMVAKNNGAAKYVRFIMKGKNNYVEVSTITAPADMLNGNFWYGADLPTAGTSYVTGRWFLQKSGTKGHIPRAFILYPTYNDPAHTYVNVWDTFTPAEGEVDWNVAAGWTPRRTIVVPIAAPLGPETFHIELALADNDKDARPVWVTVTAGGVTQTVKPTNPDKGEQLNLLVFDLANVPAGTDEIVIEVYSPSQALDGVIGDSASLVGMAANYQCSPLSQP